MAASNVATSSLGRTCCSIGDCMMGSGQLPSTSLRGTDSDSLEAARGSVRDALGAIRNLEQLLKSIKVGPKALAAVVPDVHSSCGPLLGSFRQLLSALADLGDAPRDIEEFVTPRTRELEAALGGSLAGPMNAKQRLALESVVARVSPELDAARGLVELLESTRGAAAVPVRLVDVVREATMLPEAGEATGKSIAATLKSGDCHETPVNPRLASRLLRIAVGLVAQRAVGTVPHVVVDCTGGPPGQLKIAARAASPGGGEALALQVPRLIDCSLVCAAAAARATGGSFEVGKDQHSIMLAWPPRIRTS